MWMKDLKLVRYLNDHPIFTLGLILFLGVFFMITMVVSVCFFFKKSKDEFSKQRSESKKVNLQDSIEESTMLQNKSKA
jgi:ATP/ADP translocase